MYLAVVVLLGGIVFGWIVEVTTNLVKAVDNLGKDEDVAYFKGIVK